MIPVDIPAFNHAIQGRDRTIQAILLKPGDVVLASGGELFTITSTEIWDSQYRTTMKGTIEGTEAYCTRSSTDFIVLAE